MLERLKERLPLIRPLFLPLILYIGSLAATMTWLERMPESTWRYPLALIPALPAIWIAVGVIRAIRMLDELARGILYEGLAIAALMTFFLMLGLGLLEIAGFPPPNTAYLALFMVIAWLIGKLLVSRRYE